MRPYDIKSGYTDTLTRKRRVLFMFKAIIFLTLIVFACGGTIYLLFFSGFLELRSVVSSGLDTLNSDEVRIEIDKTLNNKIFGYLPVKNDILFIASDDLQSQLLSRFPVLESVEIKKNFRHELVFNFSERKAIGVWCYKGGDCQYFDSGGNAWGQVIKSSGFLMITVDDQRNTDIKQMDKDYFLAVKTFIDNPKLLPFSVKDIIIAQDSFRDYIIETSANYPIYFSLDSSIIDQVKVLNIFLENKSKEDGFNPQYIDLRIDGRIYYK